MTRQRPRPLVAGNWKMNTTVEEGEALARDLAERLRGAAAEVALLPPFTHLTAVREALVGTGISVGAQNCWRENSGAFTGEISPLMLVDHCRWVLLGHSERRHVIGESDELIAAKVRAARAAGLGVILAVGETEEERDAGTTMKVIDRQMGSALVPLGGVDGGWLVVAYEPVWAIGTGRTATPEQAEEVCAHIAMRLAKISPQPDAVRILYGGSVTGANAEALFAMEHLDGGLIGGASLKADEFCAIVAAADARIGTGTQVP